MHRKWDEVATDEQRVEIEKQRAAIEAKINAKKDAIEAREAELQFIKDEFEKANSTHAGLMAAEEAKRKEKLKARREAMKGKRQKLVGALECCVSLCCRGPGGFLRRDAVEAHPQLKRQTADHPAA